MAGTVLRALHTLPSLFHSLYRCILYPVSRLGAYGQSCARPRPAQIYAASKGWGQDINPGPADFRSRVFITPLYLNSCNCSKLWSLTLTYNLLPRKFGLLLMVLKSKTTSSRPSSMMIFRYWNLAARMFTLYFSLLTSTILVICLQIYTSWSLSLLHSLTDHRTHLHPAWWVPNCFLRQSRWYLTKPFYKVYISLKVQEISEIRLLWDNIKYMYSSLSLLTGTEFWKSLEFSKW